MVRSGHRSFRGNEKTTLAGLRVERGGLSCRAASRAGSRPARGARSTRSRAAAAGSGHRPATKPRACLNAQADGRFPSFSDELWAAGPPGHERSRPRVWRGRLGVRRGARPTRSARRSRASAPASGAPTLALVGHIDEIGIAVTNIEEEGCSRSATLGGSRPRRCSASGSSSLTRAAPSPASSRASASAASESATGRARAQGPARRHRRDDRDEAAASCGSATPASGTATPSSSRTAASSRARSTTGSARTSRSRWRGGSRRRAAPQVDVVAVAAVQEEIGHHGARTAAFALGPTSRSRST